MDAFADGAVVQSDGDHAAARHAADAAERDHIGMGHGFKADYLNRPGGR